MHHIEKVALSELRCKPLLYKRYIDDVILGPFPHDQDIFEQVLGEFNMVTPDINFTMETPGPMEWLPFLDIKIKCLY